LNTTTSIFNLLLIDIETVPCYNCYDMLTNDWKILWAEKISKTMPENVSPEECYSVKAGILAEFGKVICISTGYFYENINKQLCLKIKSIYGDDEKMLLEDFLQMAGAFYKANNRFQFAGHNIREFDIPYICRRLLINNMQLPHYLQLHGAKPWEIDMIDTLQWWKFGDYKNYISLNLLAGVLNIPTSKDDMNGSQVRDVYYENKDLERIKIYCEKDVVVAANVILKFKNLPILDGECVTIVN
jgi:predicted PolB exonuclease-like 3'-5' exonuclease